MSPVRLILFAAVIAVTVVSLTALVGHLFLGGKVPYDGGVFVGIVCGILAAIFVRRMESTDSHS